MYESDITYIGETDFRNQRQRFGIKETDRMHGTYIFGKTGMGKSTLLEIMALSDIQKGKGLAILDPHGDVAQHILDNIPQHRYKDIIFFNPSDLEFPSIFNPLEDIPAAYRHIAVAGLIGTFKRIWADSWGPRLEHVLRFALLTLVSCEGTTLLHIQPLLTNPMYRNQLLATVHDGHILNFWEQEFDRMTPAFRNEVISPILNKVGVFRASMPLRNTFGGELSDFRIQDVMDGNKIFIANLSKGKLGEDATMILGSLLMTAFMNGAQFRAHQGEQDRVPFFLYVDEAHSFMSLAMATILAECRKYKLGLVAANQFTAQLDEKILEAIIGNVGTLITFRVGSTDAEVLAKEFYPVFNENDLIHIPRYGFYIKLCIDGMTSKAFSGRIRKFRI